jgi:hypothetical protein
MHPIDALNPTLVVGLKCVKNGIRYRVTHDRRITRVTQTLDVTCFMARRVPGVPAEVASAPAIRVGFVPVGTRLVVVGHRDVVGRKERIPPEC